MKQENLIFIISQPRSGSTLLQKLISNNEEVSTSSEPWVLFPFALFERHDLFEAQYNSRVAQKAYSDFIEKFDLKSELNEQLKHVILSMYAKAKGGSRYFLDKTPRYYEILPQIFKFFPNARFIVLKRNPFAVLNSMINTWSMGKIDHVLLKGFERDFMKAPHLIQSFLNNYGKRNNVMVVFYEDLVENPEHVTLKIYSWLGITFTPKNLDFSSNRKVTGIYGDDVYSISRKVEYKKRPMIDSKSSWLGTLKKKENREFINGYYHYLGDTFLKEYGYDYHDMIGATSSFQYFLNQKRNSFCGRAKKVLINFVKSLPSKLEF